MYIRKTKDDYQIITNYGYGEEVEVTEENWKDAKSTLKEYRENASGLISSRIKKVRVKL